MDTRNEHKPHGAGPHEGEPYVERGLGPWIWRNRWLLMRLSAALVFTFCGVRLAAPNLVYALQDDPTVITAAQIERGELPAGVGLGDYVEVRGTPVLGEDVSRGRFGTRDSQVAVASRYSSANYFYYRLEETGDGLLIQQAQTPPTSEDPAVFRGSLATVGTVIFHDTTQAGLQNAGLPRNENIPVVESSDTPQFYRQLIPVYLIVASLAPLSVLYVVWRRNKPFLD